MQKAVRAPSSPAFDWLMAILVFLVMVGVYQDGWAHSHGLVDQSFLTPWHAMLYGGVAITGITLLIAGSVGLRNGYSFKHALPFGYWLAALGVTVFLIGGAFDAAWHTRFGIEHDLQALVSPTHLLLVFAGGMMISGPLRSIADQHGRRAGGWKLIGPAVLAILAALMMLDFFTQYAQPLGDGVVVANLSHPFDPRAPGAIYRFSLATGQSQRITAGVDAYGASASPDGRRIVYRVNRPNAKASDIVVADGDGSHAKRITNSGNRDTQPAWSPDGKWIAYISSPAGTSGNFRLIVVHPDGSGARALVDGTTTISFPSWSPDSTGIAYGSRNALVAEIALVDLKSGTSSWLTNTVGGSMPSLGRDGDIAFVRNDSIYEGPALGDRAAPGLIVDQASDPMFSPDGFSLAYVKNDGDSTQVFVTDFSYSPAQNLSQLSGLDAMHPTWSRGFIFATLSGREPQYVGYVADSRTEAAFLIQSVLIAGLLLLLVRRWRAPIGSVTAIVTVSSLALSFQSDEQGFLWAALLTGVIGDIVLVALGERARRGNGSYAFGAIVPGVLSALYLLASCMPGPLKWNLELIFGTPLLAAVAGLIVAFCYEPPLPEAGSKA
ncbi:MAG TPA: hypothetical protein VMS32_11430 [Verrucomicrobiae bacterium]|nr:hypothetical protein [Verrucomicrobiae bacterium]